MADQINLSPDPAGNTVLHHAIAMDFEAGVLFVDIDDEENNDVKVIK